MSKDIRVISQECCDIWNKLKDKTQMIDYLIESKQKVADLEAKLAEKDLRIEELESQFAYECECNKQFVDCQKENTQLKQQLAEKNKKLATRPTMNITHPQETQGYLQGWVCPKCGSVMSPYQSVCPHCQPPQKLEIWC